MMDDTQPTKRRNSQSGMDDPQPNKKYKLEDEIKPNVSPDAQTEAQPGIHGEAEPSTQREEVNKIHPQTQSRLMALPQELRDEIYSHLFSSTRLAFGIQLQSISYYRILGSTNGNALAILRACHRTQLEIGSTFLRYMTFQFEDPMVFLDYFAHLPVEICSQIRHAQVYDDWMCSCFSRNHRIPLSVFEWVDDEYNSDYHLSRFLRHLPNLCLDSLTVMQTRRGIRVNEAVEKFIRYGVGYEELRYFTCGTRNDGSDLGPLLLPWQQFAEQRDGTDSQASAQLYLSKNKDERCAVPEMDAWMAIQPGDHQARSVLRGNWRNPVMVVVKRGLGVDISCERNVISDEYFDNVLALESGTPWPVVKYELHRVLKREWDPACDHSLLMGGSLDCKCSTGGMCSLPPDPTLSRPTWKHHGEPSMRDEYVHVNDCAKE